MLTAPELGEYIDQRLTRTAFRLERLDHYDVDSDGVDYERFLRGEPDPTLERKQPWLDHLRRERESGILRHRVHLLRTPLTDYLRYECEWGYVFNAAAGENIGILNLTEHPEPDDIPDHDFWLIDDQFPVRMHYDIDGRFLGAKPAEPKALPRYQRARDILTASAEPFGTWWDRHRDEWREHRAA
ncbi:DUF6879 family protein [Nonomuraea endophytica]|uniref:DUF6879 family protein n=1 Tax=Nonomuraea endophytica TaxID=714136 RepID=UPI0037C5B03A